MTVITHAGNKEWVENMARRPHTIQPDILAKNVSRLNVETVDGEREIKDQSMTVMLYHVAGNPHSDTMLMAYIPRDRMLIEVDAFSPGSAVNPYAANLLENIQKRNLRVDKIVPLHGAVAPFAELVKVTRSQDELMRTLICVGSVFLVIRSACCRAGAGEAVRAGQRAGRQGRRVGAVAARHGQQDDGDGQGHAGGLRHRSRLR